jgi:hypothetical protein
MNVINKMFNTTEAERKDTLVPPEGIDKLTSSVATNLAYIFRPLLLPNHQTHLF